MGVTRVSDGCTYGVNVRAWTKFGRKVIKVYVIKDLA